MFHQSSQPLSPLLQIQPIFQIIVPSEQDTKHSLSNPSHVSKLTLCHQKHQTFNNNKIRRYFQQKLYFSKLPKNITARHHKKISRRLKLPVFLRNPSIFVNPPFLRLGSQRQAGYYSFPIPVFNWQRPDPDPVQCPTYSLFTLDLGCSI